MWMDNGDYLSSSLSSIKSLSKKANLGPPQPVEGYLRPRNGFLSIPLELRCEIYSYLLVVDQSMDAAGDLNKPLDKVLSLQILHLNRQIREEALYVLLYKNIWIHFQIGPITVSRHDSYHIYQLGNDGRYAQPDIPVNGFLGERVKQRLAADVRVTQRQEFVEERRWDNDERAEVRKDILFAYNEGRYNHLCHLIRRFGTRAIKCLDTSIRFPEPRFRPPLNSDIRLGLLKLLFQTKNNLSLTIHGAEELQNRFKMAQDEWRSYSRNTTRLKQFNNELEEIISESAIALDRGLYNEARCRLSYVDDIQAIHSEAFLQSDPGEEARQESLERDIFIIQVLAVALDEKHQPNSAVKFVRELDLMCATVWFRGGDSKGLLRYACGSLSRRIPKARRSQPE
ncbi:hypothetical protein AJ78_03234 [Emergomyces pasteurianus Ep9510]|uniref:F-box domain-containing protein n=1 Tax=Emergomyces pasteurianus Ep9510 TaxID=1447872 RepID=A0A1J9PL49_9EURO|nr:hypothetical protein AJ78_03234 [Emergomyces pasteurianus Ep9510]